jgi:hypothetical protein
MQQRNFLSWQSQASEALLILVKKVRTTGTEHALHWITAVGDDTSDRTPNYYYLGILCAFLKKYLFHRYNTWQSKSRAITHRR